MKKLLLLSAVFLFNCTYDNNVSYSIEEYQQSLVDNGTTGSNVFKLYKNGDIVYNKVINSNAKGDKDIDENTIFAIHSMTKTVTTVATMILHEKELFSLEDPLHKYLPEFKEIKCKGVDGVYPCKNPLKIIDLLTHRSGYVYYLDNGENWLTGTHKSLYPKYISTSRFNNLDDFSKAVAQQPLEFEPGTMYSYGLNQAILGRLIEVVSGQSFYQFLKDNIFEKLGMSDTKFHLLESERSKLQPLRVNIKPNSAFNQTEYNLDGYTAALDGYSYRYENKAHFGGEGLVSTMNDFSKFCEMLVNDGLYRDERILSSESIDIMTAKYTNGYPDPNEPGVFPDLAGYYMGFTFSVLENPEVDGTGAGLGSYGWSGYHNTHFWIDPENKTYGLFMSRAIEFDFSISAGLKKASYKALRQDI